MSITQLQKRKKNPNLGRYPLTHLFEKFSENLTLFVLGTYYKFFPNSNFSRKKQKKKKILIPKYKIK